MNTRNTINVLSVVLNVFESKKKKKIVALYSNDNTTQQGVKAVKIVILFLRITTILLGCMREVEINI